MRDRDPKQRRRTGLVRGLTACALLAHGIAQASELEQAVPQAVGLLPDKLAAITARLRGDVDKHLTPGVVLLIARQGKVAVHRTTGGELDGKRLLRAETVAQMTTDQSASLTRGPIYTPGDAYGFGFGLAVRTLGSDASPRGEVGDYHWGGAGGTYFWVDPKHRLVVVLMMQSPRQRLPYRVLMRELVYDALVR